jgi:hypothetical protein
MKELPLESRFWNKVNKRNISECWEWDGYIGSDGYGQFWYKGSNTHAHRISWSIINKLDIPPKMIVLHKCDNKRCVNPYHLRLGTYSDNLQDTMERSSYRMGRKSRFYEGEVWLMKRLYNKKIDQSTICRMFKISQPHLSNLLRGIRGSNLLTNGGN